MVDAWIGWVGMSLLVISFLPETFETIKRGRSELKIGFLTPYLAGVILVLIYAIEIGEWPFIALNIALLALVAIDVFIALFPLKDVAITRRKPKNRSGPAKKRAR